MNYESGKFSKSKGVGVFGNDVKDTGIPSDVWRFYIYYVRPEKADSLFTWKDFQMKVNAELIGNLSNLVNRTLTFVSRFYDGKVPGAGEAGAAGIDSETAEESAGFWKEAGRFEGAITELLERAELREGFKQLFALAAMGNKAFQDGEPWKQRKEQPQKATALIRDLVYLVKDLAILMEPYLPTTAERIRKFLGLTELRWDDLGKLKGLSTVGKPDILFQILEDDQIESLRLRFSGTQKERKEKMEQEKEITPERQFAEKVTLKVAKITEVQRHPQADKLYLETIDVGDGEVRQIVSGLVPYYKEEELLGRNIILVANLKPAKLRGEKSEGMLLAAEAPAEDGADDAETSESGQLPSRIEVLFADHASPGDAVVLKGEGPKDADLAGEENGPKKRIKIDEFFEIPLTVKDNTVYVGSKPLVCNGKPITTESIPSGKVG
jgi:methionyl-tRNA synthetase